MTREYLLGTEGEKARGPSVTGFCRREKSGLTEKQRQRIEKDNRKKQRKSWKRIFCEG